MLKLKEINRSDSEKEYAFFQSFPAEENGFFNPYYRCSYRDFVKAIPHCIAQGQGQELSFGEVPCTFLFLWDDEQIVGLFKLRHRLTRLLRMTGGHISYGIDKSFRGQHYATEGLKMAVEALIQMPDFEDEEIYMHCYKDNHASLKVQLANGALIHHVDEQIVHTRLNVEAWKKAALEQ